MFSPKLCGFRKGHSLLNALSNLLTNWQKCLDASEALETVLMNLSKAHACFPHDLFIAKLPAFVFNNATLALINEYLTNSDCMLLSCHVRVSE